MNKLKEVLTFVKVGIWKSKGKKGIQSILLRVVRIILILIREIGKDQIVLKSSATAYLSILSTVPIVALIFGISKGFGLEGLIEEELDKLFLGQEIVKESIFDFAQKMLDGTQGGIIVGVSVIVLFYTVMKLLNNIEEVFNGIWGKQRSRNLIRKFTDYLTLLVIAPIFVILSSGVTIFIENNIRKIGAQVEIENLITPFAVFVVKLSPFVLIWLLFTMIYVIMPNVKVKFVNGLIAGVVAGTIFQITQWGFINFSFLMGNYGAVYGGLAVLPLFFIFSQLSWTVIFIGGELSYAIQVEPDYIPEEKDVHFSYREKQRIALVVMGAIVVAFRDGKVPYTKMVLAKELNVAHRFVSNEINRLVAAGLLVKSLPDGETNHIYVPSIDINVITLQSICDILDDYGAAGLYKSENNAAFTSVNQTMDRIKTEITDSSSNKLLKDL